MRFPARPASGPRRMRAWLPARQPRSVTAPSAALKSASYVIVGLAAVLSIGPFFYILSASFKNSSALFQYPPNWIPRILYWGNYSFLLHNTQFFRWVLNTMIVATSVTALKVVMDSMAGYGFAKVRFPGRRFLFGAVITGLMVPFAAILIPLYFLVRDLNLLNTYWALILPPLANPIGIFMMRSFVESLPDDLFNAARLDGCSEFGIYCRIVLPLIKAPLVVLAVLTFLLQYTSFIWPLVATSSNSLDLITTGLAAQTESIQTTNWGALSAGGVMAMIPITLVFLALQKYFVAGSLAGALKQ
jgi:multiple sugar transport system permease protein